MSAKRNEGMSKEAMMDMEMHVLAMGRTGVLLWIMNRHMPVYMFAVLFYLSFSLLHIAVLVKRLALILSLLLEVDGSGTCY